MAWGARFLKFGGKEQVSSFIVPNEHLPAFLGRRVCMIYLILITPIETFEEGGSKNFEKPEISTIFRILGPKRSKIFRNRKYWF